MELTVKTSIGLQVMVKKYINFVKNIAAACENLNFTHTEKCRYNGNK